MSFDFQKIDEYIKRYGKIARILILKTLLNLFSYY